MNTAPNTISKLQFWRSTNSTVRGVFWMVVSTLCFVCVTGIVRYIGSDLPAAESAFIRYFFGIFLVAPTLLKIIRKPLAKDLMKSFAIRGFVHAFGVTLWFFAMARIPIAEVTAIGYVTPILVTIGAALFLGERFKIQRLVGVLAGLTGALVILRPGFQEISIGQLAQLSACPLFAVSYLMTKHLTGRADSQTIVAMLTVFCTIFLLPMALLDWRAPSTDEMFWLFITACCATFGHYAMTRALQAAPVSVTQPVTFLQLVWASTLGIVAFNEPLDPYVIVGGLIIVSAATFISHREAKSARPPITPPSTATKLN